MFRLDTAIAAIESVPGGMMKDRLIGQLKFARRLSDALDGKYEELLLEAAAAVAEAQVREGALTDSAAQAVEAMLAPVGPDCKKYRLILCGHAHIDMNWMWRYDETVQITLDTFQTVLDLMREFPEFTFSQSQASVYRIVEEFAPDMLGQIAQRVREGRWEVAASTWVEADRNMPSAESVARHHLYTRRYLPRLLGAPDAQSKLDYEPDTFGHHRNTPELLQQAGVKYYYHCRGLDEHTLYRWRAPSGAEVMSYCEPFWYNGAIDADIADFVPEFCEKFGVPCALRVYGVGDHGGGPTRRDIERAIDMMDWPIFPTIEFGSYHDFFRCMEPAREKLPVVDREMNALFVGCYTTQTRIKKGNRYAERLMGEAEAVNAFAAIAADVPYDRARFEEGWRNVLFNQFHDILPGSGVPDTREHAMGLYQQAYAVANSARRLSMRTIADRVDTSFVAPGAEPFAQGEGAGVGFHVEQSINLAPVERGAGAARIFHLFNGCAFDRHEVTELVLWDCRVDGKRLTVTDEAGREVRCQLLDKGHNPYWGHDYARMLIEPDVPAMGYATYIVKPSEKFAQPIHFMSDWRVERDEDWVIENGALRLDANPVTQTGGMELIDKRDGAAYTIGGFSFVQEDASRGMTAWVTGDEATEQQLWKDVSIKRTARGELYNEIKFAVKFGEKSHITYTAGLHVGSDQILLDAECHFLEIGDERRLPQLRFTVNGGDMLEEKYLYDIPGGVLAREASTIDQPGLRFIANERIMLLSDSKYGYRGNNRSLGVTLIRGSIDPDRYPELGIHHFRLGVALSGTDDPVVLTRRAQAFVSPLTAVSGRSHPGELPGGMSFMRLIRGSVEIQAVKLAEDDGALILRGVELAGDGRGVEIELFREVNSACFADTHERPIEGEISVSGRKIAFDARKYGLFTIKLELKQSR